MQVILIPAYNPDSKLLSVINELKEFKIILINDGSDTKESQKIFNKLSENKDLDIIIHLKNQGKGAALKTGFEHYIAKYASNYDGIITVDADGQHLAEDVMMISRKSIKHQNKLILGGRKETGKMPLRSRFGNILTRTIFRLYSSSNICDTQTGLRFIPNNFLKILLETSSTGYEFELEMLLLAKKNKIKIREYGIKTVYLDGNSSSHFNPLIDSLKIYFVFIRFSANSLITAAIDYSAFILCHLISGKILLSFIVARFFSCCFNFLFSKKFVFQDSSKFFFTASKYLALVILFMFISFYAVISLREMWGVNVYLAKVIAEGLLFVASFLVQHFLIFKKK